MPGTLSRPSPRTAVAAGTALLAATCLLTQSSAASALVGTGSGAAPAARVAAVSATVAPTAAGVRTAVRVPRLTATPVVGGFSSPVLVRSAPDGTSRLFVVEQGGTIRTVEGNRVTGTYLDLSGIVTSGGERGLLGLAFAPDFARSHLLWVTYTRSDGALVLARLGARSATSATADPRSRRTILVVPHPSFANHNGGNIGFGPDGYLYLGTGDGGSAGDPNRNAQNLRSLLGKMLRINVRCNGHVYCVPPSNPFATSRTARHEIWMYGLRNPWRWSFDVDGSLWIGDVGQDAYEEVDAVRRNAQRGANLGWSCREGLHLYDAAHCRAGARYVQPVFELCHQDHVAGCPASRASESLIGGSVYRGRAYPGAVGTYVVGDYTTGRIWPFRGGRLGAPSSLPAVVGFGAGHDRELYAVSLDGLLYRVGFTGV